MDVRSDVESHDIELRGATSVSGTGETTKVSFLVGWVLAKIPLPASENHVSCLKDEVYPYHACLDCTNRIRGAHSLHDQPALLMSGPIPLFIFCTAYQGHRRKSSSQDRTAMRPIKVSHNSCPFDALVLSTTADHGSNLNKSGRYLYSRDSSMLWHSWHRSSLRSPAWLVGWLDCESHHTIIYYNSDRPPFK